MLRSASKACSFLSREDQETNDCKKNQDIKHQDSPENGETCFRLKHQKTRNYDKLLKSDNFTKLGLPTSRILDQN